MWTARLCSSTVCPGRSTGTKRWRTKASKWRRVSAPSITTTSPSHQGERGRRARLVEEDEVSGACAATSAHHATRAASSRSTALRDFFEGEPALREAAGDRRRADLRPGRGGEGHGVLRQRPTGVLPGLGQQRPVVGGDGPARAAGRAQQRNERRAMPIVRWISSTASPAFWARSRCLRRSRGRREAWSKGARMSTFLQGALAGC